MSDGGRQPELNHTIVWCRDKQRSVAFLRDILDLPEPETIGPMLDVPLSNNVSLDYHEKDGEIASQHYAFLITEEAFDRAFARIRDLNLDYWADPDKRKPGEINHNDGGRGVYFNDPDGHFLEIMTRPYGGWD